MFIAMNRFKVKPDCAEEFEQVWRQRESYLDQMRGFVEGMFPRYQRQNYLALALNSSRRFLDQAASLEPWTAGYSSP